MEKIITYQELVTLKEKKEEENKLLETAKKISEIFAFAPLQIKVERHGSCNWLFSIGNIKEYPHARLELTKGENVLWVLYEDKNTITSNSYSDYLLGSQQLLKKLEKSIIL